MRLFRHLGAAVTFSPRLQALLAEAAYRSRIMESRLSLIHAGPHTSEREMRLREAMSVAGVPEETGIYWMSGPPAVAILNAVKVHGIDLLIAGALEKERPIRYFLGSVAHTLVREAPCSLMLLTEPQLEPSPLQRIVVITDYSEQSLLALTKAIRVAERHGAERLFVVRVLSEYGAAMIFSEGVRREHANEYMRATQAQEEELLQNFVDAAGYSKVQIESHCITGHTGFVAAQFARDHQADLLVMPSSNRNSHFFQRLFPSDMEWVLREIPCNLYVVREMVD